MEQSTIRLEPDAEVLQFLRRAKKAVSEMPEWKKGILEVSSLPNNPIERPPVIPSNPGNCPQADQG